MDEEYHGYYLHCQSPFEFSDFSFEELENQMGRENVGYLIMNRGLSAPAGAAPPDCQTFEFFASDLFRSHQEGEQIVNNDTSSKYTST